MVTRRPARSPWYMGVLCWQSFAGSGRRPWGIAGSRQKERLRHNLYCFKERRRGYRHATPPHVVVVYTSVLHWRFFAGSERRLWGIAGAPGGRSSFDITCIAPRSIAGAIGTRCHHTPVVVYMGMLRWRPFLGSERRPWSIAGALLARGAASVQPLLRRERRGG